MPVPSVVVSNFRSKKESLRSNAHVQISGLFTAFPQTLQAVQPCYWGICML
ncbi:uncharacterized protein MYCFIDRAFT_170642 [Pseudocercospora fijiensis CIRAD86]|uniref:Uncharacterized protein n=1 Tax=Pseudocercospora fijiensis (strain CIRAD86) TaxID=383855 RepID=N1Q8C4_PSEFD|nr:uncharacterized protein MYCFIDRAFT_170642 [Pseudocercospora fijiensis CIRAD86]EME89130.1 hypothetical protein MYCFIDRAFT_170642 [Pseudocercospora fijiensis CIRAD86]